MNFKTIFLISIPAGLIIILVILQFFGYNSFHAYKGRTGSIINSTKIPLNEIEVLRNVYLYMDSFFPFAGSSSQTIVERIQRSLPDAVGNYNFPGGFFFTFPFSGMRFNERLKINIHIPQQLTDYNVVLSVSEMKKERIIEYDLNEPLESYQLKEIPVEIMITKEFRELYPLLLKTEDTVGNLVVRYTPPFYNGYELEVCQRISDPAEEKDDKDIVLTEKTLVILPKDYLTEDDKLEVQLYLKQPVKKYDWIIFPIKIQRRGDTILCLLDDAAMREARRRILQMENQK